MSQSVVGRYRRDDSEFDRAIAFIDATFAVALTLLVTTLDIRTDRKSDLPLPIAIVSVNVAAVSIAFTALRAGIVVLASRSCPTPPTSTPRSRRWSGSRSRRAARTSRPIR